MKRVPRVLVLTSIFPNQIEPTRGIYIYHIVRKLEGLAEVQVAAPVPYFPKWLQSKKYSPISRIWAFENRNGLKVFHPRVFVPPKVARSAYGLFYAICLYFPIRKLIAKQEPDVILSYWVYPDGFAAALLAKILNIKLILGARGCDVNDHKSFLGKRALLRWSMKRSELVLAVSKAMKKTIEDIGIHSSKIRVIPNGIGDKFKVTASHLRDKNTILYCGRFSYEKGLEYLIKAAGLLVERQINFRLVLVGDGPERNNIYELVQRYGLMDRVSFEGEIRHERIPSFMEKAGLLCLPSIREGWPNVVTEALACGCPVVASNVGGVSEIISRPDLGILVPSGNPKALADALEAGLLKDWISEGISAYAKTRTWDVVANEVLKEIHNVTAQP